MDTAHRRRGGAHVLLVLVLVLVLLVLLMLHGLLVGIVSARVVVGDCAYHREEAYHYHTSKPYGYASYLLKDKNR